MEASWLLLGMLALIVGVPVIRMAIQVSARPPSGKSTQIISPAAAPPQAPPVAATTVSASMSVRDFDPDAYRFDGSAYPEYRITYVDADGVVTEREIYVDTWHDGSGTTIYKCWCFLKDERRTFRQDRIQRTINLRTNRGIKNIAEHRMRY